jgi:hypothetical protein
MAKVKLELTGASPLLMHNIQLADPLNPIARQMKTISSKRRKTDEDYQALADLEFVGGLYVNATGPYIPGQNLEKSIIEGGKITRNGRQVERALFVTENEIPLLYRGPRDVPGLSADPTFRSSMAVKVGTSRVMRCRPIFQQWSLSTEAELDTELLNMEDFKAIATSAGRVVGLGDYRPRFGRFEILISTLP